MKLQFHINWHEISLTSYDWAPMGHRRESGASRNKDHISAVTSRCCSITQGLGSFIISRVFGNVADFGHLGVKLGSHFAENCRIGGVIRYIP